MSPATNLVTTEIIPDLKMLPELRAARPAERPGLRFLIDNALGLWGKITTGMMVWRLDCLRISGTERWSGAPLSLLYRGHGENLEYFKRLFFEDDFSVEVLGKCFIWHAHRLATSEQNFDIICCETPLPWSLLPPPAPFRPYLCWLKQTIHIPGSRELLINTMRRKTRMEAERMIRKYGFTIRLVPAGDYAGIFYRELYQPYITSRFGNEGHVVPYRDFEHKCRNARLMLVLQQEVIVGGLVLHQQGNTLIDGWTGIRMQDGCPVIPGISDVIDYCSLFIAYREGFDTLDMGTSRALLSDGTLRYKQRWGASLSSGIIPKGSWSIAFQHLTPAVLASIQHAGIIGKSAEKGLMACQLNTTGGPEDTPLSHIK